MNTRGFCCLITTVGWLLLTGPDGRAASVPRSTFGRVPVLPTSLDLLTPPERAPAPQPGFGAGGVLERELPLTPRRATALRFQARLAPITPARPLLGQDETRPVDRPLLAPRNLKPQRQP